MHNHRIARRIRPIRPLSALAGRLSPLALAALSLVAAAAPSGCALSVEVEAPDVEVTREDVAFEGVPSVPGYEEVSVLYSFDQENPGFDLPKEIDSSLEAAMVELRVKSGVENLDFLKTLTVTMRDKAGKKSPVVLFDYQRDGATPVGKTVKATAKNPANILQRWRDKETPVFDVLLSGRLPNVAWKMDIAIHFAGNASYKY